MTTMTKTTFALSGVVLSLALIAMPAKAATVAEQIQAAFASNDVTVIQKLISANPGNEGKMGTVVINGVSKALESNPKMAAAAMGQVGTLCSADMDADTAKEMASALRELVNALKTAQGQGNTNETENGAIFATAMSCAGQPAIVAADAGLYADVLADASSFQGDGSVQKQLNFARQMGLRPNNNQQPTVIQTVDEPPAGSTPPAPPVIDEPVFEEVPNFDESEFGPS
jgi:hypothetical protein